MTHRWLKKKRAGFTAIEIAMVATIIAILALIILPLFRKRAEEAKVTAALDDMRGLRDALILANAETSLWFRTQDLDNTSTYNSPPLEPDKEVPIASWNEALTFSQRLTLANEEKWQGPYVSAPRFLYLAQINPDFPQLPPDYDLIYTDKRYLFRNNGGPILSLYDDSEYDKLPSDPWGNPYLFFGIGKLDPDSAAESSYSDCVIFSVGPNGVPGNQITGGTNPYYYTRSAGILGTGDDLALYF